MDGSDFLYSFTWHLATQLESGISIHDALSRIIRGTENNSWKAVFKDLLKSVGQGIPLSIAMARHPNHFPDSFRGIVEAGEKTGLLVEMLKIQIDIQKQQKSFLNDIAHVYCPFRLIWVIVTIKIFWEFLCSLASGFIAQGYDDSGMMFHLVVATISTIKSPLGIFITLNLIALFWKDVVFKKNYFCRLIKGYFFSLPGMYNLYTTHITKQILIIWQTFLISGQPIGVAFETSALTIDEPRFASELELAAKLVWQGFSISSAIEEVHFLPELVRQELRMGEIEGNLLASLTSLISWFSLETQLRTRRLIFCRPLLLLFLAFAFVI